MRTLPLCQYTYQYFMNLQQHQAYQRDLCGACYDQRFLDFVCVDQMGTLIQPDYVSQKFQQILSKYGLRRIRFHDGCIKIGLNQKQPHSKGGTDLVLFLFYNHKGGNK